MPHNPEDNRHPHLNFKREEISSERRKKPGFPGPRPDRGSRAAFGATLTAATDRLKTEQARKEQLDGIQPHLVFRIPLRKGVNVTELADLFGKADFHVVSIEPERAIIAFKEDTDLSRFRSSIQTYERGPKAGINPKSGKPYASTAADILEFIEVDEMRLWQREDRIGARLAMEIGHNSERIDPQKLYVVEIDLWRPNTDISAQNKLNEIQVLIRSKQFADERFLDSYRGETLLLAKVAVHGSKLSQLLDLDAIAEVELPPIISFNPTITYKATPKDFPPCPEPPVNGPRLCILDSGIVSNHPLIRANVGHEEAILTRLTSPVDQNGHGTMVGGLAVFGDVRESYEQGLFASPITLFSARVLNEDNGFDDEKLIINQMREAIVTFYNPPHNCRVFNLSLGDNQPCLGKGRDRQPKWAETLDVLARELKVVLVVSAGNFSPGFRAEELLETYPMNLFDSESRLCDPATSAIAVTVGSLSQYDIIAPTPRRNQDDIARSIAGANCPSPFTRVGSGLNGSIKPEFVHFGGNLAFDGFGQFRRISQDESTSVMSFSHLPSQRLFAFDSGTSFAAPRIARLAALIQFQLKQQLEREPHPNLVRAVLASSAQIPVESLNLLRDLGGNDAAIRVCGYGLPDEDFALSSWDRRATLIAEDKIKLDHFHIFAVPIPEAFRDAQGERAISISLAYDPPVRGRFDYLGVEMDMYLIRGKSLDEVVDAYKKIAADEDASEAIKAPFKLVLKPGANRSRTTSEHKFSRKKSTLQCCKTTMKRKDTRDYGETYHLVIRAEKKWAQIAEQDYAVAVALTANDKSLYVQLRNRVRAQQRIRIRARR